MPRRFAELYTQAWRLFCSQVHLVQRVYLLSVKPVEETFKAILLTQVSLAVDLVQYPPDPGCADGLASYLCHRGRLKLRQ